MKLIDLLNEVSTQTYDYGCVMLYFDFPEMLKIQSQIAKKDIYTEDEGKSYGLEDESHCTLLFGFHEDVSTKNIEHVLKKYTFMEVRAYNASIFESPKYDVLKYNIEGPPLKMVNKELRQFPHTNSHPTYHPHMTIGYIKKGQGKKYVEMFKEQKYWLTPQYAVYSRPNGDKDKIDIRID